MRKPLIQTRIVFKAVNAAQILYFQSKRKFS